MYLKSRITKRENERGREKERSREKSSSFSISKCLIQALLKPEAKISILDTHTALREPGYMKVYQKDSDQHLSQHSDLGCWHCRQHLNPWHHMLALKIQTFQMVFLVQGFELVVKHPFSHLLPEFNSQVDFQFRRQITNDFLQKLLLDCLCFLRIMNWNIVTWRRSIWQDFSGHFSANILSNFLQTF